MTKRKSVFVAIAATLFMVVAMGASWEVRSYLEDNPHKSRSKGQMMLVVRNDSLAALAGTDGDYSPLQVDASGNLYVTDSNGAAILLDTTAIKNAVEIMDDWDETNRAAVNTIAGQVGVQGGAGAATALTQRTVTSTNSPDVTALEIIDNNVLLSKTLIRQAFRGTVADGVALEVVADPADNTTPKIVFLMFYQTVQGHTELRATSNVGTVLANFDPPAHGGYGPPMAEQPYFVGASNEDILLVNQTGVSCTYSGVAIYYLE